MPEYQIENIIGEKLSGDSQKNALDFISFLRAHEISLDSNGDGMGWAVGGTVGDSTGFMLVNGEANMPGPWTVWFNSCDFKNGETADGDMKKTAWEHASKCGRCHAGWETCGNGDRIIFGREFKSLCHSPLMFTDPDKITLENLKKLVLIV